MRFGKIFLLASFLFASVANAQDVMVDLSVLDDLDVPYKNVSKPLFPVLPKKAEVKVKKATKQKVAIKPVKKHKPKKIVEKVKPLDDDIVVVDFEPVSKPAVAPVVETPKPAVEETKPAVAPVAEEPAAQEQLPNGQREWFYPMVMKLTEDNLTRVKEDLDWLIAKYDYRNTKADWKNSRDALPRTMEKLQGLHPADPPYKSE